MTIVATIPNCSVVSVRKGRNSDMICNHERPHGAGTLSTNDRLGAPGGQMGSATRFFDFDMMIM